LEALEEDPPPPEACSTQEDLRDCLSRIAATVGAALEDRRGGQLEVGMLHHMLDRLRDDRREKLD
jgi:hypothetical protein